MRLGLAAVALLCNGLDNWTTYACLSTEVPGVEMYEANPLAAWAFGAVGLTEGLLIEMVLCVFAVLFLMHSKRLTGALRYGLLAGLAILPGTAAAWNVHVMWTVGVGPFGG
jgi:hypothetical protein